MKKYLVTMKRVSYVTVPVHANNLVDAEKAAIEIDKELGEEYEVDTTSTVRTVEEPADKNELRYFNIEFKHAKSITGEYYAVQYIDTEEEQ